jgi:hypothetical protein
MGKCQGGCMRRTVKIAVCSCLFLSAGAMFLLAGWNKRDNEAEIPVYNVSEKDNKLKEVENPVFIAEGIRKLTVTAGSELKLSISYQPDTWKNTVQYWEIAVPYGEQAVVDTEKMLDLFHKLESIDQSTLVEKGKDTGLGNPVYQIGLEFNSSNAYAENADSSAVLLIGQLDEKGNYYCSYKGNSDKVFLLKKEIVESIVEIDPYQLLIKVTSAVSLDTVSTVDIQAEEKRYQLSMSEGQYFFNEKKIEEEKYKEWYTSLQSIFIDSEIQDKDKLKDKEILAVVFHRKENKAPDVSVIYHEYDENYASVSVNGVEQMLVKLEDVRLLVNKFKE